MSDEQFSLKQFFFIVMIGFRLADFWREFVPMVGAAITKCTLTNNFFTDSGSRCCCVILFTVKGTLQNW